MKKYIAMVMVLGFLIVSVPQAKAVTLLELQKQVQSLTEQVRILSLQLRGQALGALDQALGGSSITDPVKTGGLEIDPVIDPIKPDPNPVIDPVKPGDVVGTASILVYTPNGGEKFTQGQQVNVTWKSLNMTASELINIYILKKNGTLYSDKTVLKSGTANDGGEMITIPTSFGVATNYVVQVYSTSKAVGDYSNATFSVGTIVLGSCNSTTPAFIKVLSPNGGETYTAGQQITVKWESCNIPATANIGIQLNQGNPIREWGLETTINDGVQLVTLPNDSYFTAGNTFKFLLSVAETSVKDYSNSTFTINPANPTNGNVYVSDLISNRVQIFSSTGTYISQFGASGSGNFSYPTDVAIAINGNIYVPDTNKDRVLIFSSTGTYIGEFGTFGNENGNFKDPRRVAVSANGNVYVSDTNNNRVQIFSSTGTYISKFGTYGSGNGEFWGPAGIAIAQNGNVYVADINNNRVQIFSSTGTYISQFGASGSGNFSYPMSIAIAPNGNVYVVDNSNSILIFSPTGTYISKFGTYGSGNGEFSSPSGIAITQNGNIYVIDLGNSRIQILSSTGTYISQFGSGGTGNGQLNGPYGIAIISTPAGGSAAPTPPNPNGSATAKSPNSNLPTQNTSAKSNISGVTSLPSGTSSSSTVLKRGVKSTEVLEMQKALLKFGYDVTADGSFGPKTETAVKSFQTANGFKVDGKVGPVTKAILFK
jgi:DNA-binding beta-propeller fold protein YncE